MTESRGQAIADHMYYVEQGAHQLGWECPRRRKHRRLKARPRPVRGLKRHRSARIVAAGHVFVQNLRRGHDDIARHQLRLQWARRDNLNGVATAVLRAAWESPSATAPFSKVIWFQFMPGGVMAWLPGHLHSLFLGRGWRRTCEPSSRATDYWLEFR
jgi:hypothetical protein